MATARGAKPAKVRFWRWRRSPLRRRSDTVEAWIVLASWMLALLAGLLAGQTAAMALDDTLASRRAQLRPVPAVLTEDAAEEPQSVTSGTSSETVWVKVRWTAADGSTHTGRAKAETGTAAGTRVTVWTDRAGVLVAEPPTATEARLQSALAGVLVALGVGATVLGCGRLVRRRLDRRRLAQWDAEWERVGPQWRKRMNG
jgi:hypothetical protein